MPAAPAQHRLTQPKAKQPKAHAPRRRSGSARDRGYSAAWDKFSKAFLMSNPLCEFCLPQGIRKAATVTDHDLPHRGDPDMFWCNTFTALCQSCHSRTKQSMEASLTGGALLREIAKRKGGGVGQP